MKLRKIIMFFVFALFFAAWFGCTNSQAEKGERGDDGMTPYIGENGNWWIGDKDTLIKAQGTQGERGDEGAPGKDGAKGDDGLSAYELYIKYNTYYKRSEEMWVSDLVDGKLQLISKENTIDALYQLDEGHSFITKGQIVYIAKDFAIVGDSSSKLLLKIDEKFKYVVGDYLSIKGSIVKENNMNIFGKEVEYEKTGHKDLDSSYYDKFDNTSLSNYYIEKNYFGENNTIKYIEYIGKLKYDKEYYVTDKKAVSTIINSEMFEKIEQNKDKEVEIKGYLLGSNENIIFYATELKEIETVVKAVEVKCPDTLYLGYNLSKIARVIPEELPQDVIWEVDNKNAISISNEGIIKGIKKGSFKIRAISKYDSTKASEWHYVKVIDENEVLSFPDYKGYEIKIMSEHNSYYDPFYSDENNSSAYLNIDKKYKQEAWRNIENKYNVKISFYPEKKSGTLIEIDMKKYAKQFAESGDSPVDIMILESRDIPKLVSDNVIYDLTELTNKYAYGEINSEYKESVKYKEKIYGQQINGHIESRLGVEGFVYDCNWINKLNVEDPAKMFNEGNWTYSNFNKWVKDVQSKLNENEYVLKIQPYYYFAGMSRIAGIKLVNEKDYSVHLMESEQVEFTEMMNDLAASGCVSSIDTIDFYTETDMSFGNGKVLMATEILYQAIFYSKVDNLGFVPYPYPDYMNKEDTRVSLYDDITYLYIKGKKYPSTDSSSEITYEDVWKIVNELNLKTKSNMDNDEEFDYEETIKEKISKYIDNTASIEAVMFYNESKIMFDAFNHVYTTTGALSSLPKNVMVYGNDYKTEAKKLIEQMEYGVKNYYNS